MSEPTTNKPENARLMRVGSAMLATSVDGGGVVTGVRQGVYEFDEPTPTSEELEERSAFDAPTSRGDPS